MDNMFMQGATKEDLQILIGTFFKCFHKKLIKISLKKFKLETNITSGGADIDVTGDETLVFTPHRTKLEETRNFQSTTNEKELQSFLGVAANFHSWNLFILKNSEIIRLLNNKGIHFTYADQWTPEHEKEFHQLKKEICEAFKKKPFDQKRKVFFYTNASKKGDLGYILAQEE